MRMPWSRKPEPPAPPRPLVRGCKLMRAHEEHEFEVAGRIFTCPGIAARENLPRHPTDHFIGEAAPSPAVDEE